MRQEVQVSIVMPTYNCRDFIAEAIDSILAQTVKTWELLIVDDCSTDGTADMVKPYLQQYSQIHYFKLSENGGPAVARNKGIDLATGKYVAFMDSDDLWHPEKLEKQLAFMKKNRATFCATAYDQIDEVGIRLNCICYPPERTDYHKMLLLSNPIGNTTVIYDQEQLGKFKVPSIRKRNDFALWLQILKKAPCCFGMQEVLSSYRVRKNSVSRKKLGLARYHWQLYREIEGLGVFASLFYLGCWCVVKMLKLK